jgi:hypothetical protein
MVHRKNGQISRAGQSAVTDEGLQAVQHPVVAVGIHPYLLYVMGRWMA